MVALAYGQMKEMWMVRQKTHHCSRPAAQAHSAQWMVAIPTKYGVHALSHTHTRTHARTCTHTRTHIHTRTYTHTHIRTHMHTHMHACTRTRHWPTDYLYFKMWWETLFGILTYTCFIHHSCSNNSADPYSSATACPISQQFEPELESRVFFLKHDSRVLHSTGIYHALPLQKKKHHTYNVMHYTLHVPVLSMSAFFVKVAQYTFDFQFFW